MTHNVLVVEDNDLVRELVVRRLERAGFDITEMANGRESWEWLTGSGASPDAIVLDVMLPGMDAFTLLRRRQHHESLREIPVLLLTACASEHDMIRAFELGADEYLTKPFQPAELEIRLRRLL